MANDQVKWHLIVIGNGWYASSLKIRFGELKPMFILTRNSLIMIIPDYLLSKMLVDSPV